MISVEDEFNRVHRVWASCRFIGTYDNEVLQSADTHLKEIKEIRNEVST